jgi:hypothetical protein
MLNDFSNRVLGSERCNRPESRCIPHYRTRYMYIHRVVTKGWLQKGVICNDAMGDGLASGSTSKLKNVQMISHPFKCTAFISVGTMLLKAGVVESFDDEAAKVFSHPPCLVIPSLKSAHELALRYLSKFDEKEHTEMCDASEFV